MIADKKTHLRELGWIRIENCRPGSDSSRSRLRNFKVRTINVECNDYIGLIDWRTGVTEPPISKSFTDYMKLNII